MYSWKVLSNAELFFPLHTSQKSKGQYVLKGDTGFSLVNCYLADCLPHTIFIPLSLRLFTLEQTALVHRGWRKCARNAAEVLGRASACRFYANTKVVPGALKETQQETEWYEIQGIIRGWWACFDIRTVCRKGLRPDPRPDSREREGKGMVCQWFNIRRVFFLRACTTVIPSGDDKVKTSVSRKMNWVTSVSIHTQVTCVCVCWPGKRHKVSFNTCLCLWMVSFVKMFYLYA